ncbi:hypothetical protein L873DRAFT_897332 [Choiromyces venosus 120613-1]|uniref:Uncharacterized protein n=1 Tax=Choiromyces venosus 120613-1 TaxID=1336337 RepID=A0A3N4JS08_9PEZI|nr:hypothetical protein L873DRAFT_897332 [Choiromyces venosus 120613-1]
MVESYTFPKNHYNKPSLTLSPIISKCLIMPTVETPSQPKKDLTPLTRNTISQHCEPSLSSTPTTQSNPIHSTLTHSHTQNPPTTFCSSKNFSTLPILLATSQELPACTDNQGAVW